MLTRTGVIFGTPETSTVAPTGGSVGPNVVEETTGLRLKCKKGESLHTTEERRKTKSKDRDSVYKSRAE